MPGTGSPALTSFDPVRPIFIPPANNLPFSEAYPSYFPWSNSEWALRSSALIPNPTDVTERRQAVETLGSPPALDWPIEASSNPAKPNYCGDPDPRIVQTADNLNRNQSYENAHGSQLNSLLAQSDLGMHSFMPTTVQDKIRTGIIQTVPLPSSPEHNSHSSPGAVGSMNGWFSSRPTGIATATTERRVWRSHWYEETIQEGSYSCERYCTHPTHFHSTLGDVAPFGNCFAPESDTNASFYCPERVSAVAAAAAAAAAMVAMTPPIANSTTARRRCAAHMHQHYHPRFHAHPSAISTSHGVQNASTAGGLIGAEFLYPGDQRTSHNSSQDLSQVDYSQATKPDASSDEYKTPLTATNQTPDVQNRIPKSILAGMQYWSPVEPAGCTNPSLSILGSTQACLTKQIDKVPQLNSEAAMPPFLSTIDTNRMQQSNLESQTDLYTDIERNTDARLMFEQIQDQQQRQSLHQSTQLQQQVRSSHSSDPEMAYWRMWKSWSATDHAALTSDQSIKQTHFEDESHKSTNGAASTPISREIERNLILDSHNQVPRYVERDEIQALLLVIRMK